LNDFRDEIKKITYEPAKQLIEMLETHQDKLSIEQKMDLEKLKFGLKMFDLEQEQKLQRQQHKWT
jgi:hypothetical protein